MSLAMQKDKYYSVEELSPEQREKLSPMMRQYLKIKRQNPGALLFFRLGDFYEMFFDDAGVASKELELALTGRECGLDKRASMCGVPYHSCDGYISRLIDKGYKIAIAEQLTEPGKDLVERDIVRIVTPGTVMEAEMLEEGRNNYLASLYYIDGQVGLCFVDASTGELHLTRIEGDGVLERLRDELSRFAPSEIVLNSFAAENESIRSFIDVRLSCLVTVLPDEAFSPETTGKQIVKHFGASSLQAVGLEEGTESIALGVALGYLYHTCKTGLDGINTIDFYTDAQFMRLDLSARRNLELIENNRSREKKGSLLWVLDYTKTAMGKRLIRAWIEQPLLKASSITRRHEAVEELFHDHILRDNVQTALAEVYDMERLISRVLYGSANPRELSSLGYTFCQIPRVRAAISQTSSQLLQDCYRQMSDLSDLGQLIQSALVDEPPLTSREGGLIREGYNAEVDKMKADTKGGRGRITELEQREREKTGIKNLKTGYNRVFGYYIEIPNSNKADVPPHYIRKQTLSNCERYITEELKNLEGRVLGGQERLLALEYQLFCDLRQTVAKEHARIQSTAQALARLDVLCSFAHAAVRNHYCHPELSADGVIDIKDGRHPVVELLTDYAFVPNDALFDNGENRCAIITGPNMAGKSTYMRQVALIALMNQIGSFVPASSARLGIMDAIFTRVGASDDLSAGQSTFMVEMSEVAYILKNASRNSLLILDEIGRGTSTFDGMSIARAVLEYVANPKKLGAKTLFATHYHELTALEDELDGVKNYNIAVKKRGDDITFLRRIIRGGADDSYGIEVAKLAGIPEIIVSRARQVLKALEEGGEASAPPERNNQAAPAEPQLSFASAAGEELLEELKNVDVNVLSPIEALGMLDQMVKKAKTV